VRLLHHFRLYTRTAYTWFWLVWPKTGLVHELFHIALARIDENKKSYMYFLVFHSNMILACAPVIPVPATYNNCLYMILACVAENGTCAWIIPNLFGQSRPKQEQLHVFSCIFAPTWFWLVRLLYPCRLYTRTAYTWFWLVWPKRDLCMNCSKSFSPEYTERTIATCIYLHFYSNMILACASAIPVPAIHKNCLYLILGCVARNGTCAWIIPNLFGHNRPKQEQLHVFSCIFAPTWFWLVRLLYQCRLYTRTAYTWFWLVW